MNLPQVFYDQDTVSVAKQLIGTLLVSKTSEGKTSGIIVETEAYVTNDSANHAFGGKTTRNAPMFDRAGHAYIYRIYGIHVCLNVVTGARDIGEAVLIRALEPIDGIQLMQERRRLTTVQQLCSGPGKLTQAMGITMNLQSHNLQFPPLYILYYQNIVEAQIEKKRRIGITKNTDQLLRFCMKNNPYISRQ